MTDYAELVKCLRNHSNSNADCDSCPYYDAEARGYTTCSEELTEQAADAIEELLAKAESPQLFSDNISKLPDCNTCPIKNLFEFMPEYSEYCRTTCPALLGEQ